MSGLPPAAGGLPTDVPSRPAVASPYPAINEPTPRRATAVMTEQDRRKVEADLAAARDQNGRRAAEATVTDP